MKRFAVLLVALMALFAVPVAAQQIGGSGGFSGGYVSYGPGASPYCLNLNFAASIPAGVTFTGPNNATYYNSSGFLTTLTTNTARYDCDPQSLTLRGFLYEPIQSANILTNSTGAGTGYSVTGATATASAGTGPDNTTSAVSLVEDTSTGNHLQGIYSLAYSLSQNVVYSVYVKNKSGTRNFNVTLYDSAFTGGAQMTMNPVTGVTTLTPVLLGTGWQNPQGSVQNVGNGWWKVTLSAITGNSASQIALFTELETSAGSASYTGDGSSGVYLYGFMMDYSAHFMSASFIPTGTIGFLTTRLPDNVAITVPSGCNQLTATFDDGSTQTWIVPNGTYNVPALNRPWLKSITGVSYTNPISPPSLATAAGFNTVTRYSTFSNLNDIDVGLTNQPGYKWYTSPMQFEAIFPFGNLQTKSDFSTTGSPPALNFANPTAYQDNILSVGWLGYGSTNGLGTVGQRIVGGQLFRPGMYLKMVAAIPTSAIVTPTGDPALWMQNLPAQFISADNALAISTGEGCEIDLYEPVATSTLGAPQKQANIIDWTAQYSVGFGNNYPQIYSGTFDNNFHTWELVWQTQAQNGTNGIVSWYYDSVFQFSMTYNSSSGSTPAAIPANPTGVFSHCDDAAGHMVLQAHSSITSAIQIREILVVQ